MLFSIVLPDIQEELFAVDLRPLRFLAILIVAAGTCSQVGALSFTSYSPSGNLRFSSGFPNAPVPNTSPSFVGLPYDLSGIGWNASNLGTSSRLKNGTAITPIHFAFAKHLPNFSELQFVNTDGVLVKRPVASQNLSLTFPPFDPSNIDIAVGTMSEALSNQNRVNVLRLLDIANSFIELGSPVIAYGSQTGSDGPRLGQGETRTFFNNRPYGTQTSWRGLARPGDPIQWESGDSGSPLLLLYSSPDGRQSATFSGCAWFPDTAQSWLPGMDYIVVNNRRVDTFFNPVPVLNDFLEPSGYALKWTIFEDPTMNPLAPPADGSHTAHAWLGTSGDGNVSNTQNWNYRNLPVDRPAVFDSTVASGSAQLSLAAPLKVRGMLFRGDTTGFTLGGNATLSIDYTGLRNESVHPIQFNLPIAAAGSQNWEAVRGPMVFNASISTEGAHLIVFGTDAGITVNGSITGNGSIAKDGSGTLFLNAVNSYTGPTILHDGVVELAESARLGSGDLRFIAPNPAVLMLNGTSQVVAGLSSSSGGTGTIALGGGSLSVNSTSTGVPAFLGSIEGPGQLLKSGTGDLNLGGNGSVYTGVTDVTAGTLVVSNTSGSATGTSNVIVRPAAAIRGAGRIAGNLTLQPGARLLTPISGEPTAFSPLNVGGTLSLDGAIVTLMSGTNPQPGTYTVARAQQIVGNPTVSSVGGFDATLSIVGNELRVNLTRSVGLLIDEGFTYGPSNFAITTTTATMNGGVGLSGSWRLATQNGNNRAAYVANGLSFGNLVTRGGALRSEGQWSGSSMIARQVAVNPTTNLFGSFLVSAGTRTNLVDPNSDTSEFVVGAFGDSNFASDFGVNVKRATANPALGGVKIGRSTSNVATSGQPIVFDSTTPQTYIVLFKVESLGGGEKTINTWILTAGQFANFRSGHSDALTEEELNGAVLGTANDQVLQRGVRTGTGAADFDATKSLNFRTSKTASSAVWNVTFDEVRFSTQSLSQVVPLRSELQTWRQTHFGTETNSGNASDGSDPDGDGFSNFYEYAMDSNPTDPSSGRTLAFATGIQTQNVALTFRRARPELTYRVESSVDLNIWTPILLLPPNVDPDTVGQDVTMEVSSGSNDAKRFFRLKVFSSQ